MDIMWACGPCRVHEVVQAIERPLAYTTVMTTLDRLFKKGLLGREKRERAFVYSPLLTREEWERRRAREVVESFLRGPQPAREILLSCFLEAVGKHDAVLLDELERRIRRKRQELGRRGAR
jgi:predicted transcriptional regulator